MAPSKPKTPEKVAPKKRAARQVKASAPTASEEFDDEAVASTVAEILGDGKPPASPKKKQGQSKREFVDPHDFNAMVFEALFYRANKGDLHVASNDSEHGDLFAWMQEQRRQFKLYQEDPDSSTLNADQIKVLDSLGFHWHTRGEEHWNRQYALLKQFQQENGHCLVPRVGRDKLGDFVTEQRRQYKLLREGKPSRMTIKRKAMLDELGFCWQVRQRSGWNDRFEELLKFRDEYGDTIVPQQYEPNRPLGKWVAKQREQYRLLQQGKHSFLTADRLQALNEIGFVWQVQGPGRSGRPAGIAAAAAAKPDAPAGDGGNIAV
eukprot:CAMPEP_0202495918 /NCGR_PEP_ID=MMETSP1361-20130828/18295_1 /ASSEMBLY_ACC=CAM_ASM_000849 /TAXON_ID=210615 /ORGANISM="Staurosira complex sp., Strain CCMP2646" /LENGTH=319 /DNA_ID=CAMNT_0049127103 /DNA_START=26 /DNA_END=985 /DNA_ORIENTATION=+